MSDKEGETRIFITHNFIFYETIRTTIMLPLFDCAI